MTGKELLKTHGLQLTEERAMVIDFLMKHHTHPTADEIFKGLQDGGAQISRATVFNTLNTLSEKGAVRALKIEDGIIHFDILTHPHAHFRCSQCGRIYDIDITRKASLSLPDGFKVSHTDYYITGICPECQAKGLKE